MGRNQDFWLRMPRITTLGLQGFNISLDYCYWDFLKSLRIFFKQSQENLRIKVRKDGGKVESLWSDKDGLWDEFYRLETSMEDVDHPCGAAAYMEQKGELWPF
nr:hypothetical protein [Tanacetum cinerariifolium]